LTPFLGPNRRRAIKVQGNSRFQS